MALPPLATVDDLAAWVGTIPQAGEARAEAILAAASLLVRSETRRVWLTEDDDVDDDDPPIDNDDVDVARTVVVQVAQRVWRNPGGLVSETAGPFTDRWADWAAEGLRLTETEKEMLAPYRTAASPKLWTLSTTRGEVPDIASIYVNVAGSDEPLPVSREPW